MDNIKIVFFGTPEFSLTVLNELVDDGYNIVAAVSQPDRPSGRKMMIKPTPVHDFCIKKSIDCLQPDHLRNDVEKVLSYQPDLVVTCAYGQMIPEAILKAPSFGCLNIHPSLLPKYRGGAPIHHAIWSGDEKTGVCLMEMVKAMDAGRIYARKVLSIGPDDTTADLTIRLEKASAELIREYLPKYLKGELTAEVQDESKVIIAKNISKEEEQIHFQDEAMPELYNHIRALIDWPVSYGVIEGKRMKFLKVRQSSFISDKAAGTLLGFQDDGMMIACKGGTLLVQELQLEGKNKMDASVFANGAGRSLIGKQFI